MDARAESDNAPHCCAQRACRTSEAFTGLRPARHFSRRKSTQNALRRARAGAAPASPIRCASWQPQAGAELAHPCAQTAAPFPCGCLRCSPRFTARCRHRPRIHALHIGKSDQPLAYPMTSTDGIETHTSSASYGDCAAIQRSILASSTFIGTVPSLSTSRWNARTSKCSPSAASALVRNARILICPIL